MSQIRSDFRRIRRVLIGGMLVVLAGAGGPGSGQALAQTVLYDAYGRPVYQATPPPSAYGAPVYAPAPVNNLGPYSAAGQSRRVSRRTSRRTSARWD